MKFEDLQFNKTEAGLDLKPEKIEKPNESSQAEANNFDLSQEITQSKIQDAQEIEKVRREIAAVPEAESLPIIQEKNTEAAEQKTGWLASKLDTAKRYLKVAALGAGVFMGANKLEAGNTNPGGRDKLTDKMEQAPSVDNKNEKSVDGGSLAEVVVYGRKKYEESLLKQQADIEKYAADMGKYKKDSAEWVKANQSYQDSLKLYNDSENGKKLFSKEFTWEKLGPTFSEDEVISKIKKLNPKLKHYRAPSGRLVYGDYKVTRGKEKDGKPWTIGEQQYQDMPDEYNKRNIKIKPIGWQPEMYKDEDYDPNRLYDYVAVYKKPTNEPVQPQRPKSPKTEKIKYDPKYEDLNMRSLWATMVKKNPNEKIGTLHALDPKFEKGFTLEEAMSFPQEIKDKYNIDYIYKQVKGKQ